MFKGYIFNGFSLNLWDTAGQEFFDNLRTFSYSDTDIFVLCFSLIDNESYTNAYKKWYPELKEHNKKAKIILVATKVDFRNSRSDTITTEKGKELAKKIKAKGYFGNFYSAIVFSIYFYELELPVLYSVESIYAV